ncbi:MAG: hypothetical protein HN463_02500 [Gemmatimonadales bacterium]|nr:hypothetical protein [Gemmatimonadales bacterium]
MSRKCSVPHSNPPHHIRAELEGDHRIHTWDREVIITPECFHYPLVSLVGVSSALSGELTRRSPWLRVFVEGMV